MDVAPTDFTRVISPLSKPQSQKLEEGITDARGIAGYIPLMNLLQSEKSLMPEVRTTLNWVLTGISVASNIIFIVLKLLGIGIAILSGPIGWAISAGLFALSIVISIVAYKIANKDPDAVFQKTGYQVKSKQFQADRFSPEDQMRIRVTSQLCKRLPPLEGLPVATERTWPVALMDRREALREAGFELMDGPDMITLEDGRDVAIHQFQNIGLGVGFTIAVDPAGDTYFIPQIATGHSERMAALACAACPWKDARTEAFEAAFQSILMAHGDNVIPTGNYIGGMYAQYLGLKYGCKTFCFNPYGIGPVHQQIIGQDRMARTAPEVFNFVARGLQTSLQKFSDAIDLPLTFLTGYQTPGTFGNRYTLPDSQQTDISDIMREALAIQGIREGGPPEDDQGGEGTPDASDIPDATGDDPAGEDVPG
jgi:hypothetical protein